MSELPHAYFEENNLHAFFIEQISDYGECIGAIDRFLPYVDNWSTCDSLRPRVFNTHRTELISDIRCWICSEHSYTVRFGIEMLMVHFLGDNFRTEYADAVVSVRSDEYYVNMMIAWYFATALAKNWDDTVRYIEEDTLSEWVHNRTIQKARESYRITPEQKAYLKTLKR
jgi:3-methyladenine DNA glycosylase AlkD